MGSEVVTTTPRSPRFFAALDAAWVALLLLLLFFWWRGVFGLDEIHDPVAGFLPLVVPWAGALGGVTISLVGTAKHSRDWDNSWNVWHAIRPLSGAIAGTVSFFVVVIVLRTADGLKEADEQLDLTATSVGLFFVIAFVTGFRDSIFLNLVAQVAKTLFASGADPADPVSYSTDASEIDFGDAPVPGGKVSRTVRVTLNAGGSVILQQGWYTVSGLTFQATDLPTNMLGVQHRDIEVTFAPLTTGPAQGTLKLDIANQQKEVSLEGVGTEAEAAPPSPPRKRVCSESERGDARIGLAAFRRRAP